MSWGDTLSYIAIGNPISQSILSTTAWALRGAGSMTKNMVSANMPPPKAVTMFDLTDKHYHFVRIAGLSGVAAVVMSAYGKHNLAKLHDHKEQMDAKIVFDTANRLHFLHSVALLAMPILRRPAMTGSLMVIGCVLFCGPTYYRALTGDKTFTQVATCGGFCLIAAWASLIF